jgi:hypothetical protein
MPAGSASACFGLHTLPAMPSLQIVSASPRSPPPGLATPAACVPHLCLAPHIVGSASVLWMRKACILTLPSCYWLQFRSDQWQWRWLDLPEQRCHCPCAGHQHHEHCAHKWQDGGHSFFLRNNSHRGPLQLHQQHRSAKACSNC